MLQQRGIRAFVVCSFAFERLGRTQARTFDAPELPLVMIDHPLGGIDLDAVQQRADQALPQVRALLGQRSA